MKITQERLLNIAQALVASGDRTGMPDIEMTGPELVSLLKLARLGLWAEQHGVPALKRINDQAGGEVEMSFWARDVLAALPPEPPTSEGEEKV